MPALDGTGPKGQGPRTGRGFGSCTQSKNQPVRPSGRRLGGGRRIRGRIKPNGY